MGRDFAGNLFVLRRCLANAIQIDDVTSPVSFYPEVQLALQIHVDSNAGDDGDRASGTCYVDLKAVVDDTMMVGWGYYDDEYVRVDGRWLFERRKLNLVHYGPAAG